MDGSRQLPVSLKELVSRQEDMERQQSKPRFLSKQERERLALERLEERRRLQADSVMTAPSVLSSFEERLLVSRHLKEATDLTMAARRERDKRDKRIKFDWDREDDTYQDDDPLYKLQRRTATVGPRFMPSSGDIGGDGGDDDDKHWSEKSLTEMTDRDWRIVREDYNISIQGHGHHVPPPLRSWQECGVDEDIRHYLTKRYPEPTPIQRQVIPLAIQGVDLIGLAATGSGKTMAYIVPILNKIVQLRHSGSAPSVALHGPYALIVVPTRELAQQIELAVKPILRHLSMVVLVGGHRVEEQGWAMRNGAELVIGTPGRLRDFLERHLLVLSQCHHVVLDEADRIIDMNFEEDLMFILDHCPTELYCNSTNPLQQQQQQVYKHTMMFSATMPAACEKIAKGYLRRPVCTVTVGEQTGSASVVVDTVEQQVVMLSSGNEKPQQLLHILQQHPQPPIIVFVNQKISVDFVCDRIVSNLNWQVATLHGGKAQEQREAAVKQLREGRVDVLVATDIAGRGLDIDSVALVVNYDMPGKIEDYVHRVGRTGRAGKHGLAITFITNDDAPVFYDLKQCLQRSHNSRIPKELAMHEASMHKPGTVMQRRRRDEKITAYGL